MDADDDDDDFESFDHFSIEGRELDVGLTAAELQYSGWEEDEALRAAIKLDHEQVALENVCARHAPQRRRYRQILVIVGNKILGLFTARPDE